MGQPGCIPVPPCAAELSQRLHSWLQLPWQQAPDGGDPAAGMCAGTDGLLPPAGGTCGADSCRDSCLAVNAWALGVLGVLLPLAVLWGLEERSRLLFQRQWLELHSPPGGSGTSRAGGSSRAAGQPARRSLRPLPRLVLVLWLLALGWAMWATLDAFILR